MRKPKIHKLKTHSEFYHPIFMGRKDWELRKNDRDYQIGDTLILQEYFPESKKYSGNEIARIVTFILHGPKFGLEKGYVIMSIQ